MKVVFINDCCEDAKCFRRHLPSEAESDYIIRTRGLWSKTFGIFWKILHANGDLYHVHYALQDAYLALKLGKHPLILQCCGTDVRDTLRSKKWGWVVKYNLKHADKVLCNQKNILDDAKKYNKTAEYFPIPYEPELFNQEPKGATVTMTSSVPVIRGKLVFHPSRHWWKVKENDKILKALSFFKKDITILTIKYGKDWTKSWFLAKKLGLNVVWINKVPHEEMSLLYHNANIVVGNAGVGQLDTVAIESMACGKPTVHYVNPQFYSDVPLLHENTADALIKQLEEGLYDQKKRKQIVDRQLNYVQKNHDVKVLIPKLLKIYEELI